MDSIPAITRQALEASRKAQDRLVRHDEILDNAVKHADESQIPPIAVSASQGQMLSLFCRMCNAKEVLEVGTLGGYSAIWFARSRPGIKITSIEYDPHHRDVAVQNTKDLGNVEVKLGAAADVMADLAKEGKNYDLIFIDANWDQQATYFDLAVGLANPGSTIVVDNVVRNLLDIPEEDDVADWSLIDHVEKDKRVDATLVPTLSTHKTYLSALVDGFLLAVVK